MTDDETTAEPEFDPSEYDALIRRTFDAPRERVFEAWTNPEQLEQWWGPDGFTVPHCELDVRPDGTFSIDMEAPDGTIYPDEGVYHDVDEPERLEFTSVAFEDDEGNPQLEVYTIVTFAAGGGEGDRSDTTELTVQTDVITATDEMAEPLSGMEEGYSQSFDKLAAFVADDPTDRTTVRG